MKKFNKVLVVMMVAMMAMAAMAGCGTKDSGKGKENGADKKPGSDIVGTWSVAELEVSGVTIAMDEYAKQLGQDADTAKIEMVFNEDKSAAMDTMGNKIEGTWEEKDGKYSVTLGGASQDFSITDGKLVYEDSASGAKMTFEKK